MRKQMMKSTLMALAIMFLSAVASSAEPEIYVAPADSTVVLGDSFEIRIWINADITELMGYNIVVRYDDAIAKLDTVVEGSLPRNSGFETFFWWFGRDAAVYPDTVHVNGAILGNTVYGPGVLFTLLFEGIGIGTTAIEISASEIRNGVNASIPHTTSDGRIIVEKGIAVEPTTWGVIKGKYR